MSAEKIRGIVETVFKARFGDVPIVRIDVKPGFDDYDDPVVDINVIYDGKVDQLDGAGIARVRSEIVSETQAGPVRDYGFPFVHFIARSDIGTRDPATV